MAMGAAHMFGLSLPSNFATPYRSVNIADFWRRWHMSLSFWLRDYVYFPLGGSRQGQARRYLNVMAVMLLCGLWHGTGWLFLLWGGLHGLFIIIHNLWQARAPTTSKLTGWLPSAWRLWVARLFTFVCVSLAWVFFRSPSLSAAENIFKGLVGRGGLVISPGAHFFLLWYLACGLAVAWLLPESRQYVLGIKDRLTGQHGEEFFSLPSWRPSPPHLLLVLALGLWALGRLATGATQFLYYQF
jgi:D-alanyl-lipoteichoic acid acyltransferase DltB (MBOAT superfamily)